MPVRCVDRGNKALTCKHFVSDRIGCTKTSGWCNAKRIGGGKRARVAAYRKRKCWDYEPTG